MPQISIRDRGSRIWPKFDGSNQRFQALSPTAVNCYDALRLMAQISGESSGIITHSHEYCPALLRFTERHCELLRTHQKFILSSAAEQFTSLQIAPQHQDESTRTHTHTHIYIEMLRIVQILKTSFAFSK